jgi:hypothetical protein
MPLGLLERCVVRLQGSAQCCCGAPCRAALRRYALQAPVRPDAERVRACGAHRKVGAI